MTPEELTAKLNQIDTTASQEERVRLLEEIKLVLRDANAELRTAYDEARVALDEEKMKKAQAALQ